MLSINLESLGDDALFGSGTEAWNNQSNILSAQECLISRDTNMTAQNGDVYDASHAPIVQVLNTFLCPQIDTIGWHIHVVFSLFVRIHVCVRVCVSVANL